MPTPGDLPLVPLNAILPLNVSLYLKPSLYIGRSTGLQEDVCYPDGTDKGACWIPVLCDLTKAQVQE